MRATLAFWALLAGCATTDAQVISVDHYKTRLDVGVVETDLVTYERKDKIYALFTVRGPFAESSRELNITKDGCHEVFYSGADKELTFIVTLSACSTSAYCRDEQQFLELRAIYTLLMNGSGRKPQIKAEPIQKAIRPSLRMLPC